jgi:hypothetical protein
MLEGLQYVVTSEKAISTSWSGMGRPKLVITVILPGIRRDEVLVAMATDPENYFYKKFTNQVGGKILRFEDAIIEKGAMPHHYLTNHILLICCQ